MTLAERKAWLTQEFSTRYGQAPSVWTRAPGRVDLMGSHTDYNQGFILTMTIDRDTWLAARPRLDRGVQLASLNVAGSGSIDLDAIQQHKEPAWLNYVAGMAKVMQDAGYQLTGFDGLLHTTVPVSSGLSSSAALEMAAGRMFEALAGFEIDAVKLALLGQAAENKFVGVQCGILDQYTSAKGQAGCALMLDSRTLSSRDVRLAAGIALVICDTRAKRELAGSQYGLRRAQCEQGAARLGQIYPGITALRDVSLAQLNAAAADLPPEVAKRCRFIVEENARVLALADALPLGDRAAMRDLCAASFAGARDLYEIVVPEMEAMMAAMMSAPGVIGARQAGAGFGGCMVSFVEADAVPAFVAHVQTTYAAATGLQPNIYATQPAPGAGVLADS